MAPQPELSLVGGEPVCGTFTINVNFDYPVFSGQISAIESHFTVGNGAIDSTSWGVGGDNTEWHVDIDPTPDNNIPVTVQLGAGAYQDGMADDNEESNLLTVTYNGAAPQPVISTSAGQPVCGRFTIDINFGAPVFSGQIPVIEAHLTVGNGTIDSTS